jgi:hypothetical protein
MNHIVFKFSIIGIRCRSLDQIFINKDLIVLNLLNHHLRKNNILILNAGLGNNSINRYDYFMNY